MRTALTRKETKEFEEGAKSVRFKGEEAKDNEQSKFLKTSPSKRREQKSKRKINSFNDAAIKTTVKH